MIYLKKGEIVPLHLQLVDLSSDETVKCFVYSGDKKLLDTIQLIHFKSGYYYSDDFKMTDDEYIIAIYKVTSSDKYEVSNDLFFLKKEQKQTKFLTGKMYTPTYKGFIMGKML